MTLWFSLYIWVRVVAYSIIAFATQPGYLSWLGLELESVTQVIDKGRVLTFLVSICDNDLRFCIFIFEC